MSSAHEIVAALGGKWFGGYGTIRCVVHDDRSPSLKLRDGEKGALLVSCYVGCEPKEILTELRRRGLLKGNIGGIDPAEAEARSQRIQEAAEADRRKREKIARALWRASKPAAGTIVESYLRSRGITIAPPPSLRFEAALEHPDYGAAPAMVAAVQHVSDGRITGIHRTFIKSDGRGKAFGHDSKLSLGSISTAAVRLAALRPGQWLIVGEGIESTLSAMQATGLPGWAALSTSGMKSLVLPSAVKLVVIAADNDANAAGETAARVAAERWLSEGRRVRIAMPPTVNSDFNDLLQRGEAAEIGDISHAA